MNINASAIRVYTQAARISADPVGAPPTPHPASQRVEFLKELPRPRPRHITREIRAHARINLKDADISTFTHLVVKVTDPRVPTHKSAHRLQMRFWDRRV